MLSIKTRFWIQPHPEPQIISSPQKKTIRLILSVHWYAAFSNYIIKYKHREITSPCSLVLLS